MRRRPGDGATLTWTGSINDNWNLAGNWNLPLVTPANGDNLVFPVGSPYTTNNDCVGVTFNSITITGGSYDFTGNPLITYNLTVQTGSSLELDDAATATGAGTVAANANLTVDAGYSLDIQGTMNVAATGNLTVWGTLTVDAGGSMVNQGNLTLGVAGNLTMTGNATLDDASYLEVDGRRPCPVRAT